MQTIHTITFPDQDTLDQMGQLPKALRPAIWDLRSEPEGASLEDIQGVILPYIDAGSVLESLKRVPNLKLVKAQSTGFDGIREAAGPSAAVANASGVHAAATAELAIGLILARLRGIDDAARNQSTESWRPERRLSLADRRVLLLGVGGIGQEVALRLQPFEVELTRVGSSARDDAQGHIHGVNELAALAAEQDILVAVTPLTPETHHLVGEKVLAADRKSVV
jgi:phosphoglycerate dehydrogenase-like enzyme